VKKFTVEVWDSESRRWKVVAWDFTSYQQMAQWASKLEGVAFRCMVSGEPAADWFERQVAVCFKADQSVIKLSPRKA
jgi:hypothetical protein